MRISLPSLTKNEKIFIFSAFIVILLFWGGFVGYFLIKLNRIVNSETKPIDTSAYRLPTSSPTIVPTQQPKQKPTLARFTDSEYNFSFIYPSELTVKEIDNPREKLLEFAQKNYSTISSELNFPSIPTPSLESFAPVVKRYEVYLKSNLSIPLMDATIIKGNYALASKGLSDFGQAYKNTDTLLEEEKPSYYELQFQDNKKASVLRFFVSGTKTYTIAYYPLTDTHFLQIAIQPEAKDSILGKQTDSILTSVRLP